MLSSEEINNKWHGHVKSPKPTLININMPHHININLLPLDWDFRMKQQQQPFYDTPSVPRIDEKFEEELNINANDNSIHQSKLYKSFDGSLLHHIISARNPVDTPPIVTNASPSQSKSLSTIFGNLTENTIKSNHLESFLLHNNHQIYATPFLIQHSNHLIDHIIHHKEPFPVNVISTSVLVQVLVEYFMSILNHTNIPISKFRISGTTFECTSQLMAFISDIAVLLNELLSFIAIHTSSNDVYLSIVANELQLLLDAFPIIICHPFTPNYPNSRLPLNPYYTTLTDCHINNLQQCHNISSIHDWLFNFHYMLNALVLYCTNSNNYPTTLPIINMFIKNSNSHFNIKLRQLIYNQSLFKSIKTAQYDAIIQHHLTLSIIHSTMDEIQSFINHHPYMKYMYHLKCIQKNIDCELDLLESMMPKQMSPIPPQPPQAIQPPLAIEPPTLNTDLILSTQVQQEIAILQWRKQRLTRHALNKNEHPAPKRVAQETASEEDFEMMQVDSISSSSSFEGSFVKEQEDIPMTTFSELIIVNNDVPNSLQMILIRDVSCVLDALLTHNILQEIEFLFHRIPIAMQQQRYPIVFHRIGISLMMHKEMGQVDQISLTCDDTSSILVNMPFFKNVLLQYYMYLSNLYSLMNNASMVELMRLKGIESDFILGIQMALKPIHAVMNLDGLITTTEMTWDVNLDLEMTWMSRVIKNVVDVCLKKINNLTENIENSGIGLDHVFMAPTPCHLFGTKKWFRTWETWLSVMT